MSENILEINNLSKYFGGLAAVSGCSLKVKKGTITGIIGPNGSGKTTLFNLIAGNLKSSAGSVMFNNENEAKDNSFVWVINFIHDYENFCRKLPFWSLTLSIQKNNETIFSILQNPIIDILIFSEKGSGSVNNQRKVRAVSSSIDKIIGKSKNISIPHSLSSSKVLSLNSISIELVYLCLGIIDYYLISNDDYLKNQDCVLIAKEAGILINKFDDFFVLANEKNMNNI